LRGGLDVEVYLDRLLGATTIKRSSTFLKKVHPRQNPGYAYDSVEQSAISALHDNSLSLSTCGLRLKVCLFERWRNTRSQGVQCSGCTSHRAEKKF